MTKRADPVWLTLDDLVARLLAARFGEHWSQGAGVTLLKDPDRRGYFDPRLVIEAEIRYALETGRIVAHGELRQPRPGELGFVEVHAAEWPKLSFGGARTFRAAEKRDRFTSFSVRSVDAHKLWPRRGKTRVPTMPKSPYQTGPALEIFSQNGGWPGHTQGAAARHLAALYSKHPAIDKKHQPSPATVERWVRDWSRSLNIERGSKT